MTGVVGRQPHFPRRTESSGEAPSRGDGIPEVEDFRIPFGKARQLHQGEDCTVVSYGLAVQGGCCLPGIQESGIHVDLFDLRSLVPYDKEAVIQSVRRQEGSWLRQRTDPTRVSRIKSSAMSMKMFGCRVPDRRYERSSGREWRLLYTLQFCSRGILWKQSRAGADRNRSGSSPAMNLDNELAC